MVKINGFTDLRKNQWLYIYHTFSNLLEHHVVAY
jgi:hypothetical protein